MEYLQKGPRVMPKQIMVQYGKKEHRCLYYGICGVDTKSEVGAFAPTSLLDYCLRALNICSGLTLWAHHNFKCHYVTLLEVIESDVNEC